MSKFGERLKEKMKEKGLKQAEFAERIGITQTAISQYLNDKRKPTPKTVQKIADALGCSVEWLNGNDELTKGTDEPMTNYSTSEVYRGDVYFVKMSNRMYDTGVIDAGRPAVVVSNNQGNYHSSYVQVVYLTTKEKKQLPTHVPIICRVPSTALCEQVQTVSKDRLIEYVRTCTEKEMQQIDEALKISLGLEETRDVFDFANLEAENKELKSYIKEAREKLWEVNESFKNTSEEYAKLKVRYEELKEAAIFPKDYDPTEVLKLKTERDTYKQQYEALLDRLLRK